MLILPLHKPLSLATFPLVTALLVLVNVLVYFGWQVPDEARFQEAQGWYQRSGLAELEAPAYRRHLMESGQGVALHEFDAMGEKQQSAFLATSTTTDVAFQKALQQSQLFDSEEARTRWSPLRAQYQTKLDGVFTLRHLLRSSEWSLRRMLSSAFLHGDPMHLFGNMVFLILIGLLLEGALGGGRFLAVYLLGALGSSAVSVLWRWGEAGGGLGASGAIAAIMGAFCVVWGLRPVRLFYWVGILFNYVRAPAIWLLPVWLGWELFNLFVNQNAGIGFDAHAGGLVTGALLGGALVLTHQTREDFMREEDPEAPTDSRWEQAKQHMGRMENGAAERLLSELAAEQPHRFDVAVARYRVACNAGKAAEVATRALDALALDAEDLAGRNVQREMLKPLLANPAGLSGPGWRVLLERCLKEGWLQEAEEVLTQGSGGLTDEVLAQGWLRTALRHGELHAVDQQKRLLENVVQRYPQTPQAGKARFLLDNG